MVRGLIYYAANAGITQLVECKLPKLDVASSSLVARSIFFLGMGWQISSI